MAFDLGTRTAIVTGAGRSVGQGIAVALAAAGARVVVNDLHADRAAATVGLITGAGGSAVAAVFDVTDAEAVAAGVEAGVAELGPIDVLVHNAGIAEAGMQAMFATSTPDDWRPTIDVNLFGALTMARAVLPGMVERGFGRIIQISSGASSQGLNIGVSAYGAAKAAAESLMRHIAVENGAHGVTANSLALGLMDNVAAGNSDALSRMARSIPVGRLGSPADVGAACVFLASDEAAWLTGQVVHLNGGTVFGR